MGIRLHKQRGAITATAGTVSANIQASWSMLKQIYVKATTGNTTFDVKLTDSSGDDRYHREDEVGILSELLDFPSYGNLTLTIENSTADEEFIYHLIFQE